MKNAIRIMCMATIAANLCLTASAVTIETVHVGNVGNTADTRYDVSGHGAVNYQYDIGKHEVTSGQYIEFLNAVDPTGANAHGLYNSDMASHSYSCRITWNSGSSTYDFSGAPSGTASDWQNRPVNFISWYDAAMFSNWATSGSIHQGAYDTSAAAGWGSYTASDYTGITPHDSAAMDTLVSVYGKVYVIPTKDEWYKAAYYDGDNDVYYDYPTGSNTEPGRDMTEATKPGNNANYFGNPFLLDSPYHATLCGEFELSDSPYGTFDQGGNVWEWNETLYEWSNSSFRCKPGGSLFDFDYGVDVLHASAGGTGEPTTGTVIYGFRVASIPEPSTMAVLVLGGLTVLRRRRSD
ncbi:MAG: SUMF1/EgtB/PvdO family nonheme iron enzyme [Phycisphaerales bacterium]|jgi:formylglycine-generating enzyme|nr:SUMF1/EgtB/PvdO family nonheme iron enzyme [Phycisphaerales bacterium]